MEEAGFTEYEILAMMDERTCAICGEMNGRVFSVSETRKVINSVLDIQDPKAFKAAMPWQSKPAKGMTNAKLCSSGQNLPPFHGRCRCTLIAVGERAAEENNASGNATASLDGDLQSELSSNGLSSGKVGDTDGISHITAKEPFDISDSKAIDLVFEKFAEETVNNLIEKAVVISSDGHRYDIDGNSIRVGIHLVGEDSLKGATAIHNHPGLDADSFSRDDFGGFFKYKLDTDEVSYNRRRHRMKWVGKRLTEAEALQAYDDALDELREDASNTSDLPFSQG
jgi:hypothetical protein